MDPIFNEFFAVRQTNLGGCTVPVGDVHVLAFPDRADDITIEISHPGAFFRTSITSKEAEQFIEKLSGAIRAINEYQEEEELRMLEEDP